MTDNVRVQEKPLYRTILEVGAIWIIAMAAYYTILPLFGVSLSYNTAPFLLAAYLLVWLAISVYTFSDLFYLWVPVEKRLWVYGILCIGYGTVLYASIFLLSTLPTLQGKILIPYSDLLFATPFYFIPKAVEVLLQQALIAALVIALSRHTKSLRGVMLWYAILFGGTHALIYALNDAPTPYALAVTMGALASSAVFPYLILKVRSGFVHSYIIHLSFYIFAALVLHTWPPPGYF